MLCHHAECNMSFIVMLKVIMLRVVMLNVIMLGVVMLNVVMLNVIMLRVVMLNVVMVSDFRLGALNVKNIFYSLTKQDTLMRRSTVMSLHIL
jgi:hypothetical protein